MIAWTCRWVWVGVGALFAYIIGLNFVIAACLAYLPRKCLWLCMACSTASAWVWCLHLGCFKAGTVSA